MKDTLAKILLAVNIPVSCLLIMAYLAPLFPPDDWWIFTFVGTATTYLIALHILFFVLWLAFSVSVSAANLFLVCCGFSFLADTIQWNYEEKNTDKTLRIISCNVGVFSYQEDLARSLMYKLSQEKPDILCIQEFYDLPHFDCKTFLAREADLKYYAFYPIDENYGLIIFSKFPIKKSGMVDFSVEDLGTNGCLYADIKINKKQIRVYNTHLSSMRIQKHLKEIYNAGGRGIVTEQDDMFNLLSKMRRSWKKQVPMCEELKAHMELSDIPVILCGDMNSTPYSYILRKLSEGMQDTYRSRGRGLGFTFRSNFPLLRIDYIFVPEQYRVTRHVVPRMLESDHFPVLADIVLQ